MRHLVAGLLALLVMAAPLAHAGDGTCARTRGDTCVEGPATRSIDGVDVYRACWRYEAEFTCLLPTFRDDCAPLAGRGCSPVGSRCLETTIRGACLLYEHAYQCRAVRGSTATITDCGSQRFCLDGRCFDTSYPPDPDFARVVTGLEVQREAGKYLDPNTLDVFQGQDNRCHKKLFGLLDCCQGAGGTGSLFSNLNLIGGAGRHLTGALGSSYTYDALFAADAPDLVLAGFEALFGAGGGSSALAGLLGGELSVELFVEALVPGPWSIAMLAIQLSGMLSCAQAEQVLALKRDNRLCHGVGSYCSVRVPILRACLETTETYCCFNSRLARILNEQGRAQFHKRWGTPQNPDCSGFSLGQLQALDFSRLDLSEFYAEIRPTLPNVGALQQGAQQTIDGYFGP